MRRKKCVNNDLYQKICAKPAFTEDELKDLDKQNYSLLTQIENGSTSAMADLLVANGRYIENIVKEYAEKLDSTTVVDAEDLRSEAFVAILGLLKDNHIEMSKTNLTGDIRTLLDLTLSAYVAEANNHCDEHLSECVKPGEPTLADTLTTGKSELDDYLLRQDIEQFRKEEGEEDEIIRK